MQLCLMQLVVSMPLFSWPTIVPTSELDGFIFLGHGGVRDHEPHLVLFQFLRGALERTRGHQHEFDAMYLRCRRRTIVSPRNCHLIFAVSRVGVFRQGKLRRSCLVADILIQLALSADPLPLPLHVHATHGISPDKFVEFGVARPRPILMVFTASNLLSHPTNIPRNVGLVLVSFEFSGCKRRWRAVLCNFA